MKFRYLIHKFWYFIWFVALPLSISWVLVDMFDRMRLVDEFEPWYVLLLFAILVIGIYSFRERLPFWQDRNEESPYNRHKRVRAARELVKRISRIVRKFPARVSKKATAEITDCIKKIEEAISEGQLDIVDAECGKLDGMATKHLTFARKSAGREYFESIGVAVLIALGLRLFAIEAFKIPSESMVPTLMVGDHIFVSKYRYGISIPFRNKQLVKFADPDYGDVIVFSKPSAREQGFTSPSHSEEHVGTDFIKRVIALPGDTVEVKRSVVYVNGKPIPRCAIGRTTFKSKDNLTGEWVNRTSDLWLEKHGDHVYTIVEEYPLDHTEPFKVPEGQVFVFGDNRDRSSDSRMWGTVPIDNIKGRAMVIWWSNERPHGFAWDRVGNFIMGDPHLGDDNLALAGKCDFEVPQ